MRLLKLLYYFTKDFLFLLAHHPIKSLWLNFKMLPFRQAIRCPLLIYSKTEFRNLSGSIILRGGVKPFSIKIGNDTCYPVTSRPKTIWDIRGKMVLGGSMSFIQGTYILVAEGATLTIGGGGTFIGSDSKIMCFENITIGNNVQITWENQIYDTSFHYIESNDSNQVLSKLTKPIVIGNNCWIGNRCTISKGCVLPDYSILGNGSLANKNYSDSGECCLLTGYPAVIKKSGVRRIFDEKVETELDEKFGYHRNHL